MAARCLSCSQNAHGEPVLLRWAQLRRIRPDHPHEEKAGGKWPFLLAAAPRQKWRRPWPVMAPSSFSTSAPHFSGSVWVRVYFSRTEAINDIFVPSWSFCSVAPLVWRVFSSLEDFDPLTHVTGFFGLLPVGSWCVLVLPVQYGSCCLDGMRLPSWQD